MADGNTQTRVWDSRRQEKNRRLCNLRRNGKVLDTSEIIRALETVVMPGDKVVIEGNNQKQADFLARSLCEVNPDHVHDLHMIIPSISLPEHLDIFEKGIARKLDFSYSGTQSLRISQLLEDDILEIGAIHTYIELYARLYVDLIPNVVLIAGYKADRNGNLYTGPSTEDTPALVEAAAFHDGIVIAQVNEIVENPQDLPRVDIPGSWVDAVVASDKPFFIEPLFTRDPRQIKNQHILMAMMAIKGIYARHAVQTLNHGIGFNTAAIELLLPTFGQSLGLKGKICQNLCLNPHPTLIPAIESGWVQSIHCFGGELKSTSPHAPMCSSPVRTGQCVATEPFAKWQANTPLTCSSDQHSKSTPWETLRQLHVAGFQGSVALQTWGMTHTVAVMQRKLGLT